MSQHLNIHTHQQPAQMLFKTPKHTINKIEKKLTLGLLLASRLVGSMKNLVELKSNFNECDNT